MHTLKLIRIGHAVGLVLPPEVLAALNRAEGELVFLSDTSEGFVLTQHAPAVVAQLQAGREFMRDYHMSFHELAK
jgi:antitoxin component of MazEF toxin-antitoxin module